ncbi:MAG: TonB-dependent receptor [Bacteroidetes bacterium]|nr:TonB-dependent receptor [Bacteroidota bacterium]
MINRTLKVLSLTFLTFIFLIAGPTGKIRGKVVDSQTGEALPSAIVIVEGTSWGATTDVDGQYIILNIPAGTYIIKATFIGYAPTSIANVQVSVDLTTSVDFKIISEAVQLGPVIITREAPLINKSKTNTIAIVTGDALQQMPIRGVTQVFALSSGVVSQGGDFYVRGGRAEETAYYVDGVLVNNPINGRMTANVISNAIEEVQSQIGGMSAEYGNAMSGVVNTSTRIGASSYNGSFEIISDDFGNSESKRLGAYSYGLNEYAMTIGGPITSNAIRFFVAGQRIFNRSGASFMDGINFPITFDSTKIIGADFIVTNQDSVGGVTPVATGKSGNRTLLTNLLNKSKYDGGRSRGGVSQDSWALQGNVFVDLGNINLKLGGSYNNNLGWGGYGQSLSVIRYAGNDVRTSKSTSTDQTLYSNLTYLINPSSFITLKLNSYSFNSESGDPIWMDNVENYGNPNLAGNEVLIGPSRNPSSFSYNSFSGSWPGTIPSGYSKIVRSQITGKLDYVNQINNNWELKLGAEKIGYTIRTYSISALNLYSMRKQYPTATDWFIYNQVGVSFYGYDIWGKEFNGGSITDKLRKADGSYEDKDKIELSDLEGPRKPGYTALYLQNKFEFEDLIMNLGLRYDLLDPGSKQYKQLDKIGIDDLGGIKIVADSSYQDQEIFEQFSPRFGFSFPVTDKTVFHATYGKYIQQGRLGDYYDPRTTAAQYFQGGYARRFPNPNLKPERTTQYEVGFQQQFGDVASTNVTFYYKDTKDLHVIRVIFPAPGSQTTSFFATENGDFGTSKGFSLDFTLRRINRLALRGSYTFSRATSTGSSSSSHFNIAWQDNSFNNQPYFPVIPAPTDFDRTHIGNVNLDYRFENDEGPEFMGMRPLSNFGVNALYYFSSGFPFTRSQIDGAFSFSGTNAPVAYENLNTSQGPWSSTIDLRVDKSFTIYNQLKMNIYMIVQNLLNQKNLVAVYSGTGSSVDDGWFTTESGKSWAETNGEDAVKLYNYLQDSPGNYGSPRIVKLGLQVNF